ncbi:hypothetical protein RclHR1_09650006 [Rhizophagus clarus]|uniref:DNA primase/nucleoside triphosphatase C-terminal domain-containing protein n=1 Tax=Rhizophagus clarus TaxID=94130 RepID=A0A2Z6S545_9GLOM|nr:hypothetical protein RclHR1_09650006 [Rhizophagus clarus]
MKIETMRDQLPNPIQFIIDYISSWSDDQIAKLSSTSLYQNYVKWCDENGEKLLSNNIFAKLCESGLGDMEEFSDIPQDDLPKNETTDIPIFNPSPNTSKDKEVSNQDDSTQALFNYVTEDIRAPVTSISGTSKTSKRPELIISEPETIKLSESNKPINKNTNMPLKEIPADSSNPNELSSVILLAKAQRDEHLRKKGSQT